MRGREATGDSPPPPAHAALNMPPPTRKESVNTFSTVCEKLLQLHTTRTMGSGAATALRRSHISSMFLCRGAPEPEGARV